eukprot:5594882-Pleurochrysis_carterae.AAC.1
MSAAQAAAAAMQMHTRTPASRRWSVSKSDGGAASRWLWRSYSATSSKSGGHAASLNVSARSRPARLHARPGAAPRFSLERLN